MAKQTINLGTAPLGSGGDTPRSAWIKAQSNFDELYGAGVGVTALTASDADLNTYLTAGVFSFSLPTANGPGFAYGTLEVQPRAPSEVIQIARAIVNDAVATRRFIGGTWTPWLRGYVESITNSNGTAVKLPDGTMMCRGTFTMPAQAISTPSGGGVITFPAAFVDANYSFVHMPQAAVSSGAQSAIGALTANGMYYAKSGGATLTVVSYAYRYAVETAVLCSYIAHGRWY